MIAFAAFYTLVAFVPEPNVRLTVDAYSSKWAVRSATTLKHARTLRSLAQAADRRKGREVLQYQILRTEIFENATVETDWVE